MKLAKGISALGLLAMTVAIGYAFIVGDFATDGAAIMANPWGIVSLVDLYVGFILFSMWIVYREGVTVGSVIWVVLMMVLGNWTAALYALLALVNSKGDWRTFWLGRQAG